MSEELKFVKLKKVAPGNVLFSIHPASNMQITKEIYLTNRNPVQVLPIDWALGIFVDDAAYSLYRDGVFTFENNEQLVKAAYDAGVYFDDKLDFEPAVENNSDKILTIIKTGRRSEIEACMKNFGKDAVKNVAITHANELSVGVVNILESLLGIQLILDGSNE